MRPSNTLRQEIRPPCFSASCAPLSRYLSSALIKSAASAATVASAKPNIVVGGERAGGIDSSETLAPPGPTTTPAGADASDGSSPPAHKDETGEVGRRDKEGEGGEKKEEEGSGVALVVPPAAGVRRLLLTGNRLGDAGARALASALKKDRSLEVLDLSRCCFCCCCRCLRRHREGCACPFWKLHRTAPTFSVTNFLEVDPVLGYIHYCNRVSKG